MWPLCIHFANLSLSPRDPACAATSARNLFSVAGPAALCPSGAVHFVASRVCGIIGKVMLSRRDVRCRAFSPPREVGRVTTVYTVYIVCEFVAGGWSCEPGNHELTEKVYKF